MSCQKEDLAKKFVKCAASVGMNKHACFFKGKFRDLTVIKSEIFTLLLCSCV